MKSLETHCDELVLIVVVEVVECRMKPPQVDVFELVDVSSALWTWRCRPLSFSSLQLLHGDVGHTHVHVEWIVHVECACGMCMCMWNGMCMCNVHVHVHV